MSKIKAVPDLRAPLVQIWGDLRAPKFFTVEVDDEDAATKITLELEIDGGERVRCRRLEVQTTNDAEVTGETLRQIPVARWADWGLTSLLYKMQRREDLPEDPFAWPAGLEVRSGGDLAEDEIAVNPVPGDDLAAFYERYASNARRPRRGSPVTDAHLKQVADLYRAAVERGDPPTLTVAETMHVARSTAARWVGLARSRELLGASIPGRAGEAPQKGGKP